MQHVHYFQVGSHIGDTFNDGMFNKVQTGNNIILIEPVPYLFETLKEKYAAKTKDNQIIFLNVAISNKNDSLTLYIPSPKNDFTKFPGWASQLASVNKDHIPKHISNLAVDTIQVPCYTLNKIFEMMEVKTIDTLLVDTEGHDYDILMDLDLSKLKPTTIEFEHKHMDGVFTRGERFNKLMNHLSGYGYKTIKEDAENITLTRSQ